MDRGLADWDYTSRNRPDRSDFGPITYMHAYIYTYLGSTKPCARGASRQRAAAAAAAATGRLRDGILALSVRSVVGNCECGLVEWFDAGWQAKKCRRKGKGSWIRNQNQDRSGVACVCVVRVLERRIKAVDVSVMVIVGYYAHYRAGFDT